MNDSNNGQQWQQQHGQYGYANQTQYPPVRQPMVVIPQRSPEELQQFYSFQNGFHPAQNYQQPNQQHQYAQQQQMPQQNFDYGFRHPQLQYMQPAQHMYQQAQYNQHMFQGNFAGSQQVQNQQVQNQQVHQSSSPTNVSSTAMPPSQPQRQYSQSQSRDNGMNVSELRQSLSNTQAKRQSFPSDQSVVSKAPPQHVNQVPQVLKQVQSEKRPQKVPQVVIPAKHKSAAAAFADAFATPPPPKPSPPVKSQSHTPQPASRTLPKVSSKTLDGTSDEDADQKLILLALADQYISAARSLSTSVAQSSSETDLERYQELMTLGLQCLDATIRQWKVGDTRTLVKLRLQYATLLFEESDSDDIAQLQLSQGITSCERSKLLDQKLSMQHVLARIQFKTKPKAAFKVIDGALEDVTAYKNVGWIYVFRFLRATLALQLARNTELQPTLQNLRQLIVLAESRRDIPVMVMAHILEANVHLRSGTVEAIEQAQRAIAAARSYQLDRSLERLPQLRCMIFFQDLCCDLAIGSLDQLEIKIHNLQELVDAVGAEEKTWPSGNFYLPTSAATGKAISEETCGILKATSEGAVAIAFRWINKTELFTLSFLLCGVSTLQKNCMDSKAEHYISEGISYATRDAISPTKGNKSLEAAFESSSREENINVTMHIYRVITYAIRSNWTQANAQLTQIGNKFSSSALADHRQMLLYLDGVIKQGSGDLRGALNSYNTPELSVPSPPTTKISGADLETRLVATINRTLILKSSASTNAEGQALLQQIAPICDKYHNQAIQAAAKMLQATPNPSMQVIQLKEFLQHSLQIAQRLKNQQLKTLLLNVMNARFFMGIVGDQANKSSTTAWQLARQMRSPLWMAVSGQNLAYTHSLHGRVEESKQAQHDAEMMFSNAPEGVRKRFES
ncbi:Cohesin loading factor-like protein [Elsinoe fawcettii]|nr:Cohesin loading factor-like protein [Elsinoe fawcettii]